jgi:DNA adenine methylase
MSIIPQKGQHYSPLRYPGGKASLSGYLDKIFKINSFHDGIYVEPFAGGAGAAIALLVLEKVDKIVINDLDRAIYAFWNSIVKDSNRFIDKILETKITIAEWKRQRVIYSNKKSLEFELGFATFFLNRTNRSGIIEGGPIGGMQQDGKWLINARFNKERLIARIEKIVLYKKRITVTNMDGLDLLQNYKDEKSAFFYLDPPYCVKGSCLYLNHYVAENHSDLAQLLNRNCQLKWVLTYDDVPLIQQLYVKRRQEIFQLNYSAHTPSKGQERMIFSDSLLLSS